MHHRAPQRPHAPALFDALFSAVRRLRVVERALVASLGFLVAAAVAVVVTSGDTSEPARLNARTAAAGYGLAAQAESGQGQQAVRQPSPAARATADRSTAAPTRPDAMRHRGDHRREQPQPAVEPNPNCSLAVPADPTSATGLATPYQLTATDGGQGGCHETNPEQSAFVEAAILDLDTDQISVYHPLVVDQGSRPAAPPKPVTLPERSVVGIWFGFNGDTLALGGPGAGQCVNELAGSPFGQFAYCNAPAFFAAANAAIDKGSLVVPPLGTTPDGAPCPTTRDFLVVDQDQSDNLATAYRVIGRQVAQTTPATATQGRPLTNGSDEGLLANAIDPALGCRPWTAPDLTNPGTDSPALALNELSAARHQAAPVALTPTSDPMTQVDGKTSVRKTNLYRAGVNMPPLGPGESPQAYCAGIRTVAPARLATWGRYLAVAPSPSPGSDSLLEFLANRLKSTLDNLHCAAGTSHSTPTTTTPTTPAATTPATTTPATTTPATTTPLSTPAPGTPAPATSAVGAGTGQVSTRQTGG